VGDLGTSGGDAGSWRELPDEELLAPPDEVTHAPVDPLLDLLPTNMMSWPNFERLLKRVTREVEGLRAVQLYGVPGQDQGGIDIVGINPAGENEAVQGKKYQTFTVGDLDKAVGKYLGGSLPFVIRRLAVGVSCRTNDKKVVNRVIQLNEQHANVDLEVWDQERLSEMLRRRPDIVREFFGETTAARFCGRYTISPQPAPPLDAVAMADAVMRGPSVTSGADGQLEAATRCRATDSGKAAAHIREAQRRLRTAGFAAHAKVLDATVVDILSESGRAAEAAFLLAESVWSALGEDSTDEAARLGRRFTALAGQTDDPVVQGLREVAEAAIASSQHPLGLPPDLAVLTDRVPVAHQARLLLLAGESELAQGRAPFSTETVARVRTLLAGVPDIDETVAVRLELSIAESTGDWAQLLSLARTRKIARPLAALVLARHARSLASGADPDGADAGWNEAVEQGCLAKTHADAANWLYSQAMLATRYRPLLRDPYRPLASALEAEAGQPPVAGASTSSRERALSDLHDRKLRPAAIRLQRYLRDAAVGASWADEHDARQMLADVLQQSGELELAARHLLLAGNANAAHDLGLRTDQYLDVTEYLDEPTYWVKASVLRLIAAQADVVPDAQAAAIAERALSVLDQIQTGELRDTPFLGPSAHLAAHEALAALSKRLTLPQAERLLDILEPLATVSEPNQYRHTDESHAVACTGIGHAFPRLAERSVDQLLALLERASHAVPSEGRDLILEQLGHSRRQLERQRDAGGIDARELLAQADPESVSPAAAEEAAAALTSPSGSRSGSYDVGTIAVSHSAVARQLPPERRAEIIRILLGLCRSPYEAALNRREYLLAASNLTDDLPEGLAGDLFDASISVVQHATESEFDIAERMLAHPLGGLRVNNNTGDERPAAAFLAARLARSPQQRTAARDAALRLLGATDDGDFWCTRALQVLADDLTPETVPVLATLGWPVRSLAAIMWAKSDALDSALGITLSKDPDQRVRRALAAALSTSPASPRTDPARQQLGADPRFSVRNALHRDQRKGGRDHRRAAPPPRRPHRSKPLPEVRTGRREHRQR
jgi:hypothetical protein